MRQKKNRNLLSKRNKGKLPPGKRHIYIGENAVNKKKAKSCQYNVFIVEEIVEVNNVFIYI